MYRCPLDKLKVRKKLTKKKLKSGDRRTTKKSKEARCNARRFGHVRPK